MSHFQRIGNLKRSVNLFIMNSNKWLFEIIGMDFIGSINAIYILVQVDSVTQMIQLNLCSTTKVALVIRGLEKWVRLRGKMQ